MPAGMAQSQYPRGEPPMKTKREPKSTALSPVDSAPMSIGYPPIPDSPAAAGMSGMGIGAVSDSSQAVGPGKVRRGVNPSKMTGHRAGQGDGTKERVSAEVPSNLVNQIVLQHLQQIGQAAGPQPRTALEQMPPDLGLPPGGLHEPGAGIQTGGPGGGPGGPQAGPGAAGQGNPIAPFLAQVLNPRAAATSAQGAVPTLPGAPQGFDLYHMLQLLHMFRSLYGALPIQGSSAGLPTGVPGPGY